LREREEKEKIKGMEKGQKKAIGAGAGNREAFPRGVTSIRIPRAF